MESESPVAQTETQTQVDQLDATSDGQSAPDPLRQRVSQRHFLRMLLAGGGLAGLGQLVVAAKPAAALDSDHDMNTIVVREASVVGSSILPSTPIRFKVAGDTHLDGKLGIGTDAPTSSLHVVASGTSDGISIDGTSSPSLCLRNSGASKGVVGLATSANQLVAGAEANDVVYRAEGGAIRFSTDSGNKALVVLKGSNVGIGTGTATPSAPLHLHIDSAPPITAMRLENAQAGQVRIMLTRNGDTGPELARGFVIFENYNMTAFSDHENRPICFWTGSGLNVRERMRIDAVGNVLVSGALAIGSDGKCICYYA